MTCPEQGVCTSKVLIMCVPWKVKHKHSLPCNNPMTSQSKHLLTIPCSLCPVVAVVALIGNWVMQILLTESLCHSCGRAETEQPKKQYLVWVWLLEVCWVVVVQRSNSIHSIWSTEVVLTFLPSQFFHWTDAFCFILLTLMQQHKVPFPLPNFNASFVLHMKKAPG